MRVWHLSVAYIGPKSRTERPRKTKIGTELGHVTRDWHHFQGQKIKGQLAEGGGILWRPPAQLVFLSKWLFLSCSGRKFAIFDRNRRLSQNACTAGYCFSKSSICPSHCGIVCKRMYLSSFHSLVRTQSWFIERYCSYKTPRELQQWGVKYTGVGEENLQLKRCVHKLSKSQKVDLRKRHWSCWK